MVDRLSVLIVGIGNAALGDEGVGIHALERLRSLGVPKGVTLLQCDSDLLSIESSFAGQRRILIIDAIQMGDEPGTIHCLRESGFGEFAGMHRSAHRLSAVQWAMVLKRVCPQFSDSEFIFLGVEPRDIMVSDKLSPPVEAALGALLERIRFFFG